MTVSNCVGIGFSTTTTIGNPETWAIVAGVNPRIAGSATAISASLLVLESYVGHLDSI